MTEKKTKGFASLDRDRMLSIASAGGKAAHAMGRAHEFTSEQARIAGRKGAEAKKAKAAAAMPPPFDASTSNAAQAATMAGAENARPMGEVLANE